MTLAHKTDQFTKAKMAEDPRYRSRDPFGRAPAQGSGSAGDPLAELARLIGQNDPFADHGRERAALPRPEPRQEFRHEPRAVEPPAAIDWRSVPVPASLRGPERAEPQGYPDAFAAPQRHAAQDFPPTAPQHHGEAASYDHAQFNGHAYSDAPGYPQPAPAQGADAAAYDPAAYGQQAAYESDPYYREDQSLQPAESYDDSAPARRRGGLLTVLAVLALAIVGTAGAFGYRAMFGKQGVTGAPPVIRADAAPTKVVPATQPSEPQSNKLIYDRVGDRNQGEKIVAREEQPVQIRDPNAARSVFPAPGQTNLGAPQGAAPTGAAAASTSAGVNEPKKIRTVTIRADQPTAPSAPPPVAMAPARTAAPVAAAPVQPEPAPRAVRTQPIAPSTSASAPLSLAPAAPAPQAAPAPRAAATMAARAPAPIESGSYTVQVSSQRTESEAQNSYRSLQAKYPSVLGDRQAIIRRADLGEKGTYYRAQVGPFGSSEQANTFCNNLRSAGGQCVVQRN